MLCECGVPVSVRGPPPQRYSRAKCAVPDCARPAPQSSDCVRVRSLPGPAHFASLRSAAGAVGRAVGTGARARSRGGHSAPACPCGVRCAPHPPMSGIWLGRNTSRRRSAAPERRCAHPAARARSGPVPRRASAGALVAHVRFCGARSAPLTVSKGSVMPRNCAEDLLAIHLAGPFRVWQYS